MHIVKKYQPRIYLFRLNGDVEEFKNMEDLVRRLSIRDRWKISDEETFFYIKRCKEIDQDPSWCWSNRYPKDAIVLKDEFGNYISLEDYQATAVKFHKTNNQPQWRRGSKQPRCRHRLVKVGMERRFYDAWDEESKEDEYTFKKRPRRKYQFMDPWYDYLGQRSYNNKNWKIYRKHQWR